MINSFRVGNKIKTKNCFTIITITINIKTKILYLHKGQVKNILREVFDPLIVEMSDVVQIFTPFGVCPKLNLPMKLNECNPNFTMFV